MNWHLPLLQFLVGLVGLTLGADWLVRGASRLAAAARISPLVIGLTVVAYGTSAPEMAASVMAAVRGHSDVALGNILGSNIANVGLILGLTALLSPLRVSLGLLRRELPIMLGVTVLFYGLAWRLEFGRVVGTFFLSGLVAFSALALLWARRESQAVRAEFESFHEFRIPRAPLPMVLNLGLTALGMALLIGGGHWTVDGAVVLARHWGVGDLVIGASMIAVGTSLPELATSLVAAWRREADICVGNLVGSNLFNILGALGLSAVIRPLRVVPSLLRFEFVALLVFSAGMALVLHTGQRVSRLEGGVLLVLYGLFLAALLAQSAGGGLIF